MESFSQTFQLSDAGKNNRRSKPAPVSNATAHKYKMFSRDVKCIFPCPCLRTLREFKGHSDTHCWQLVLSVKAAQLPLLISDHVILPRKRPCSLSLNNSFLHYILLQFPVPTENTLKQRRAGCFKYAVSFMIFGT